MFDSSLLKFIISHQDDDPAQLMLDRDRYSGIDLPRAVRAITARRKLKTKLPAWADCDTVLVTDPVMVEQASSSETALYKSYMIKSGGVILDLSGGLGVDSFAFSQRASHIHYVEIDPERCDMACHNFTQLKCSNITIHCGDAEQEGLSLIKELQPDVVYVDPDRRVGGRERSFLIEDSSPNICILIDHLHRVSPHTELLIKLSPMVDLTYIRQMIAERMSIHIVSLRRECKEILVHLRPNMTKTSICAVELFSDHSFRLTNSFTEDSEGLFSPKISSDVGRYFYDLYPSVAKFGVGAFPHFFSECLIWQPHSHTHLYFSQDYISDFPGRGFEIIASGKWQRKKIAHLAKGPLHLVAKNFPVKTDQLRRQLHICEGGELFLFAYTSVEGRCYILARQIS